MADNVSITSGSGTVIAADDVGSVYFQRVKLDMGGDGASSPVISGNGLPVAFAAAADFVSGVTGDITDTTSTQVIAAVTSKVLYITSLMVTNSDDTTGTFVNIQDGSGGTTLWSGYAAILGGGFAITFPVPIKTTSGNGLYVACATTGATVRVCAAGYKA